MNDNLQFPFAFHALMMIAYFYDTRITSEMIADSIGCNAVTIRNIFRKLKKAGLLIVKTGIGGTALGRPAAEITLWDIYSAVEPENADNMFRIHTTASGYCPIGSKVKGLLQPHLNLAANAAKLELSNVTLAQLLSEVDTD